MGHYSSLLCPVLSFFVLLWISGVNSVREGYIHHPNPFSSELEFPKEFRPSLEGPDHLVPPYHRLPVFRHAPAPFVGLEHLRPMAERRAFPSSLSHILVPQTPPQPVQVSPVENDHGVEVWCGYRKVSVRINRAQIGFKAGDSGFFLGTCPVSDSSGNYLYFNYDLSACGSSFTAVGGKFVYLNQVEYRPEAQQNEKVVRAVPLTLPIQCLYNRFHYSYKLGYVPRLTERTFWRSLGTKRLFSLTVCDEQWKPLAMNDSVFLGEPMFFEASVAHLAKNKRVFLRSCHVTASEDASSTPRYDIIRNSGCLVDSRRAGSRARFVLRRSNILRFSLEAFLFPRITSKQLYLHCAMLVGAKGATPRSKSCTYNQSVNRWEELEGDDAVCDCCDSECDSEGPLSSVKDTVVTSRPWSFNPRERLPGNPWEQGMAEQGRAEVMFLGENTEEEEEVLLGELSESLDSVAANNKQQQNQTWPIRKQETKKPVWNEGFPAEEEREGMVRKTEKENLEDVLGTFSQSYWVASAFTNGETSPTTSTEELQGSPAQNPGEPGKPVLVEEETVLKVKEEPEEWRELQDYLQQ
ncbi:zona pellucida glycoprotein 3d tandem duplicate 1 [Hoplias malabaricus]|uniref:zona pellucida glycoprotein 3d tandem duplicate 1 n=1 Tax=Hoplias malabaricus TaxID=27720 RepID=UPI0034637F41